MKCAVYVTQRSYGPPGPCENEREVRKVLYSDETMPMCAAHRAMVHRGQHLTLKRDITPAEHRRRVATARMR